VSASSKRQAILKLANGQAATRVTVSQKTRYPLSINQSPTLPPNSYNRSVEPTERKRRSDGFMQQAARYTSIAMAIPASVFVGYAIGYMLDKWLGTHFLYIVFLLLGIASGFWQLIRELSKDQPK
jgi:hypothetical protein